MLNHCIMNHECKTVPFQIVSQEEIPFGYPNAGLYRKLALTNQGALCPHCGTWSATVHEYQQKQVISGSYNELPVIDQFVHRRFECGGCHCTFMEPLLWLKPYQRMSENAQEALLLATSDRTFKAVGEAYGRSGQNVKVHVMNHCSGHQVPVEKRTTPVYMGIDEISLAKGKGKYRLVMYDFSIPWRPQLLLIHQSRLKNDVITILKSLPHPERIIGIAIDMWEGYKTAIETALPHVTVVIDAFHVIQASMRALDQVRKDAQKTLTQDQRNALKQDKELLAEPDDNLTPEQQERVKQWEKEVPELAQAIRLHQKLRALYHCQDFEEALDHLIDWEKEVLKTSLMSFHELLKTVWNWLPEIMNRFLCRISNAKTEGKNNQVRAMNKQGFGYSLASLQARMQMREEKDALKKWRKHQERCKRHVEQAKNAS